MWRTILGKREKAGGGGEEGERNLAWFTPSALLALGVGEVVAVVQRAAASATRFRGTAVQRER